MNSLPGEHRQESQIPETEITKPGIFHAGLGIFQTRTLYKIRKCFYPLSHLSKTRGLGVKTTIF